MTDAIQTGPLCLAAVLRHHGKDTSPERIVAQHGLPNENPSAQMMVRMANAAGLRARRARLRPRELMRLGEAYPALAQLKNGNWVTVLGAERGPDGTDVLRLLDPMAPAPGRIHVPLDKFRQVWRGELLLAKRDNQGGAGEEPFGFRWFAPEIMKQGRLFGDVAVAARSG